MPCFDVVQGGDCAAQLSLGGLGAVVGVGEARHEDLRMANMVGALTLRVVAVHLRDLCVRLLVGLDGREFADQGVERLLVHIHLFGHLCLGLSRELELAPESAVVGEELVVLLDQFFRLLGLPRELRRHLLVLGNRALGRRVELAVRHLEQVGLGLAQF